MFLGGYWCNGCGDTVAAVVTEEADSSLDVPDVIHTETHSALFVETDNCMAL